MIRPAILAGVDAEARLGEGDGDWLGRLWGWFDAGVAVRRLARLAVRRLEGVGGRTDVARRLAWRRRRIEPRGGRSTARRARGIGGASVTIWTMRPTAVMAAAHRRWATAGRARPSVGAAATERRGTKEFIGSAVVGGPVRNRLDR